MRNKKGLVILMMIIVLITLPIGFFFYFKSQYENALNELNSTSTDTVEFEILSGESLDTIVPNLIDQELLRKEYQTYFLIYLKANEIVPYIQAGKFEIPKNLNIIELTETLKNAQEPSVWVTIPEGLRTDEIAKIISENLPKITEDTFINTTENQEFIQSLDLNPDNLNTLEGFLHPDKYLFKKDSESQEIIRIMIENFKTKVPQEYTYNDIILASLIEREAVNAEDRRIVSGILQKRLNEQWLLQVDATLLYHHKDWAHIITVQDKELDHPYNSYKWYGLTPQPICNPGLDAIKAIYEPTPNDYYYYIHDNDRTPHYSKTLEEHERKVQKYLR